MAKELKGIELIEKKQKELQELQKLAKAGCSHVGHNGKLKVVDIGNGMVSCKKCEAVFSAQAVTKEQAKTVLLLLGNMINQLKLYCDPEKEQAMIQNLGSTLNSVESIVKTYNKGINEGGFREKKNKKKNKKKSNRAAGTYGTDNMFGY